jgi:hypothetical protein
VNSETLAEFREGLLPRRKARQVAAHLAHCARCAGRDAQLAELPALLARSPAPPMPAALTARIEAALAAEAAARPATADRATADRATADRATADRATADRAAAAATAARGHRKTPAPRPGRSRLALRAAAAAAAVVVLAGGGYGLTRLLAGGSLSSPTSSALAPAAGSKHAAMRPSPNGPQRAAASGVAPSPLIVHSGTNYQPGQLSTQVRATLLRFGHGAKNFLPGTGQSPAPLAFGANLSACLQRVTGGRPAELVDVAHYEGRPAAIIVIPGARANTLRVLVVGTGCSAAVPGPVFSTLLPSGG